MPHYAFKTSNVGVDDRILATEWFDVNNSGERVGTCWGMQPISAIHYKGSGNAITSFGYGKSETNSHGINNRGMIVGRNVRQSMPGLVEGFSIPDIEQYNVPTFIHAPDGAHGNEVYAVNDSGVLTGLYYYTAPSGGKFFFQMFTSQRGVISPLGEPNSEYCHPYDINDHGHIVGGRTRGGFRRAFLYDGAFHDLQFPDADDTSAYGINNKGHIVGWYQIRSQHRTRGFLLADGVFSTIDFPDASSTSIHGINDSGMIVGSYRTQAVNGFVATPADSATPPESELLQVATMKHLQL